MAIVKTVDGLALSSVKTFDGLAAASLKTINGQDTSVSGGITWVGAAGTDIASGTVSPVINYPTVATNDIMLAYFLGGTTNSYASTPPTGWTKIVSLNDGASDSSACVLWRRADGTEGATLTWTDFMTSSENGRVIVVAYRGCVASGSPINISGVLATDASTTSKTIGPVTTTAANCMMVAFIGCDPTTTSEFTFDAGPTTRINRSSTPIGNNSDLGLINIADAIKATAGSVSYTGSYNEVESACAILVGLTPA